MVDRDSSVKCFYLRPYFPALFINWNFNRNRFAENIWSTWRRSCPHQRRLALDDARSGPHGFSSAPKVFSVLEIFISFFSWKMLFAFRMLFNMFSDFSLSRFARLRSRRERASPSSLAEILPELFLPFAIKVNGYRKIRFPLFMLRKFPTQTMAPRKKDKATRLRLKRSREGCRIVTRLHKHFISPVNVRLAQFSRGKCFLITARGKKKRRISFGLN